MGGLLWTAEETALLIVFDMWAYKRKVISAVLTSRAIIPVSSAILHPRTVSAIDWKLRDVRYGTPGLWSKKTGWNQKAVALHLHQSCSNHALVDNILSLTFAECEAIKMWQMA
ncbi:hypothetical protein N7451_010931 [Penicillium sp. IBT 35674x]|nr:hypothetical protein N7451_010931 [Penicillium sp. IBT 35674x]